MFAALGVRECTLVGEILPEVPIGVVVDRNGSMVVVTKAGGFGGAETLAKIARRLRDR